MSQGGSLSWYRGLIDGALRKIVAAAAEAQGVVLTEVIEHALSGGKRVRGTLLLDFARSVSCTQHTPMLVPGTLDMAVVVEMLQAASLVVDDLRCFDGTVVRRGRPATHAAYGERAALMAAVSMFALATVSAGGVAAVRATGRHVSTEMMAAVLAAAQGQLAEAETGVHSETLNALKTGALFAASTAAGAALGGASPARVVAARAAGAAFGSLFQAADDAMDTEEDGLDGTEAVATARRVAAAADDALIAAALEAGCVSSTLERLRSNALAAVLQTERHISAGSEGIRGTVACSSILGALDAAFSSSS